MRRSIRSILSVCFLAVVAIAVALIVWTQEDGARMPLRIAMAPYQDLAMIVNAKSLGLEKKYGTDIELITLGWEDIPPAVASAGRGADIGFGSYIEYLTKYEKLNAGSSDPVLFVYPLYAFKGGSFVTFKANIPQLVAAEIADPASLAVRQVLAGRIGAQKASVYEMMLLDLAMRHGINAANLRIIDSPLDQAFLAAENGDLDIAEAGLTQLTETIRRGGHVVFSMDDVGFADITGFIVKKSVYDLRKKDVDNAIRMWFDCVDFVYRDISTNSASSLEYLNKNASTRYSIEEYKKALGQEYLPRTISEAIAAFISPTAKFSVDRIGKTANATLVREKAISGPAPLPRFPSIE